MIFVLDNYDSFTYNLVQYIGEFETDIIVRRNDKITVKEIKELAPNGILISPGPKTPKEAGISKELIKEFSGKIPILGVCLGHQAIAEVFGAKITNAKVIMHGKISTINHNEKDIFNNIPNKINATRYHSLIVDKSSITNDLEITASTDDNVIMGLLVKKHPQTWGVQFHPESMLTEHGHQMIKNFVDACNQ